MCFHPLVECATLFHSQVDMFMHQHILNDYGILGKVKEYVNQYELQHCGSLHAHIILWVDTNDLERITNEIIVLVPTIFDDTNAKFILPSDSLQSKLFHMVL
jgi:hypothetical protein